MNRDKLILVNEWDQVIGQMGKQEVHEKGYLHRAFSVFIFNTKGQMLLQQRSQTKYHSPGLWTNACCSHPSYGEELNDAVARRLMEEMGLSCPVTHVFQFQYRAVLDQGMIEHELDHVFIGISEDTPYPDREEVQHFRYEYPDLLKKEMEANPDQFTVWFKQCFDRVMESYQYHENQHYVSI